MKNLSSKQKKELRALAAKPDSEIDLTDIPEIVDWGGAVVGKFYRPIKKSLRFESMRMCWPGSGRQRRATRPASTNYFAPQLNIAGP